MSVVLGDYIETDELRTNYIKNSYFKAPTYSMLRFFVLPAGSMRYEEVKTAKFGEMCTGTIRCGSMSQGHFPITITLNGDCAMLAISPAANWRSAVLITSLDIGSGYNSSGEWSQVWFALTRNSHENATIS